MLGDGIEGILRPCLLLSIISSCLFIVQMISTELPSSYSLCWSIFIAGLVAATDVLQQSGKKKLTFFFFFCIFLAFKKMLLDNYQKNA